MGGGGRIQHPVADRNSTSTHKQPKAVFFDKGAQTYYGYDYKVHTDFAASTALAALHEPGAKPARHR